MSACLCLVAKPGEAAHTGWSRRLKLQSLESALSHSARDGAFGAEPSRRAFTALTKLLDPTPKRPEA